MPWPDRARDPLGTRPVAGSRSRFPPSAATSRRSPCRPQRRPRRAPPPELTALTPAPGPASTPSRPTMGRCRLVGRRHGRSLEARRGERRPQTAGRPDDPTLDTLIRAGAARDPARARQAALQVEQAPSTSSSATVRRPESTWTAWTCGPGSCWSTPPPRTGERSPATPPPSGSSGTAPATASTPPIPRRRAGQRRAAVPWRGGEQGWI